MYDGRVDLAEDQVSEEENVVATVDAPRKNRQATPERWVAALRRGIEQGINVRQTSSGIWVASSGTDPNAAYEIEVSNGYAYKCSCQAGEFDDPVCKHRAVYWYVQGMLNLPEEE